MAIKVSGNVVIDNNRKFIGQKIQLTAYATESLPSAIEGDVAYDSTDKKLKVYDGSAWV